MRDGVGERVAVKSMPGVYQYSVDQAVIELKRLERLGVGGYILFGVTEKGKKDAGGSWAMNGENEVCRALRAAKEAGVKMVGMTDLCFCEYTDHGHCGPLGKEGRGVENDATIRALGEQAVVHAKAGADVVAPSGMMDHMVGGDSGSGLDGRGVWGDGDFVIRGEVCVGVLWAFSGGGGIATGVWGSQGVSDGLPARGSGGAA